MKILKIPLVAMVLLMSFAAGLVHAADGPVYAGDKSMFVRDVTLPDDAGVPEVTVKPNEKLTKIWEIKNAGTVHWKNRWLRPVRSSAGAAHLKSIKPCRIPDTPPGKKCQITSELLASDKAGTLRVDYKMTDDKGRELLPDKDGVFLAVNVDPSA